MEVILTRDIKALGEAGKLVKVKPGHARNYLLPMGFAIPASPRNIAKIDVIKKQAAEDKLALHGKYSEIIKKMDGVELTFVRKADENNHLFGSVSENDIVKALAEKEIEIHKADVVMEKHLKEIGTTDVVISFMTELQTTVKVNIEVE
jgi:large subunit ribosomal protein L9